ncbi:hypothetical protein HNR46_000676 [Haloferula luteola]|uniref:Planctomycete cytochrome C n=1 Tax=Haloferula luteola TaxID=595692 RepID=A0A840UXE7_9BACT|nr:DUF1549 domain-containing protein [Haloferula luteola]MBB5350452.1 hypothetical protein [Haloferula luteola]
MRALVFLLLFPSSAWADVDFAHQVVPLLKKHCFECHGGDKSKGGFSINSRDSFLSDDMAVPGSPEDSEFLTLIADPDPEFRMPPEKHEPVPEVGQRLLEQWVAAGMPWEDGFTFGKPAYDPPLEVQEPPLPPAHQGREHPIDRLLDAWLTDHQLPVPPPAEDAAFLRRATLDLTGLLPTVEETRAFLDDPSPDKRDRLIDRLLTDDIGYADHWLSFWNDLLRNDYEGTGYIDGGRRQITAWLYASLAANKPYDQLARELIAPPSDDLRGFIDGIRWRGEVSAAQSQPIQFSQSLSQSFLGINMKCASCHDSFVDRWKLNDAYGLAAIYAGKPLEMYRCDQPTGKSAAPRWLFPEIGDIDPAADPATQLDQLARLVTHPDNGRFTKTLVNRLWAQLMGRGISHPLDAMKTEPWSAELLDHLAWHFRENGYNLRETLAYIAHSAAYQSAAAPAGPDATPYRGPQAKRLTAESFTDAIWQITQSGPSSIDAPLPHGGADRGSRPVRASLVKSNPLMRSLGRPNRDQIVTSRPEELTALEALDLSNDRTLAEWLESGAHHLASQTWPSLDALIDHLFLSTLNREPTAPERSLFREQLGDEPSPAVLTDALWALCMTPDFLLIP